jgi:DNA polymerase-1
VPPSAAKPRLVVLDSHGILYRAFFAMANSDNPLMTSKGELTFATHGYAETLIRVLDMLKPTHICAAWDAHGPTFRHEASVEYKATRRPTPPELLPQMARVREMLDAFSIPVFEYPGFEADDVAGTIAKQVAATGMETYIATLDTDLVQLIGPNLNLFMFRPYQRDVVDYNEARAAERYGFSPIHMIDYKSLKGDTSDNIEGIKGIGEKTATDLIRQFGGVPQIYENIELTKGALKQKLVDGRETAFRNLDLVRIHTDLELDFDLDKCRVKDFDREKVMALFRELEFRVLAQRLDEVLGSRPAQELMEAETDYCTISTEAELSELAATIRGAGQVALATVSTTGDTAFPLLLGLSFSTEAGKGWYIPIGHTPRMDSNLQQLTMAQVREVLGPILADESIKKTAYNTKYLLHQLDANGMTLAGYDFDVSIAAFLLGETSSALSALANERLGIELITVASLVGSGRNATLLAQADFDLTQRHACQHAEMLWRLRPQLEAQLNERGQWPLYWDMEMPLMPVLYRMERHGVAVDTTVLREISRALSIDAEKAEREIYAIVGHEFNIGSPKQLSDILFGELQLPKTRKTTQGYSTDQRSLEALRPVAPIIDLIFSYRELTKLKGTYTDALPASVAADGRIHTDFQQTVAATGRLSSTNPNLQNIPVRSDTGRDIRRAFVASHFEDAIFVAGDYSQIELRVLAHVTKDEGLVSAFLADQDIHRATAATVYGVEPDAVTRQMRDTAKMVNFGIAYGMGEFGLASRTGMTREEAEAFISSYYRNFPGIALWQQQTLSFTREKGYAETLFGRRRYLPAIRSTNFQVRSAAEREGINMPIQGTAADIIKVAMIRIDEELRERELRSRMILQVHDELIFECPMDEVDAIRELATRVMPASLEMNVPLKVDLKQGKDWGAMQ